MDDSQIATCLAGLELPAGFAPLIETNLTTVLATTSISSRNDAYYCALGYLFGLRDAGILDEEVFSFLWQLLSAARGAPLARADVDLASVGNEGFTKEFRHH